MYMYNWYHSDITGIHYVHRLRYSILYCRVIPLLFAPPFSHSPLFPIRFPLLTWNPPCCDRIRPPLCQTDTGIFSLCFGYSLRRPDVSRQALQSKAMAAKPMLIFEANAEANIQYIVICLIKYVYLCIWR
jgi:hypothetical protein